MAVVGLHDVQIAAIDPTTEKIISGEEGIPGANAEGILDISVLLKGTSQANITGLDDSPELLYGNDTVVDATYGSPAPQIAFNFNDLPFSVKNYCLGFKDDGNGAMTYSGIKPLIAVLIESRTPDMKQSVYFGFRKTLWVESGQNLATNTNKNTREADAITAVAIGTQDWNGQPIKKGFTGSEGFDVSKFMNDVFGKEAKKQ